MNKISFPARGHFYTELKSRVEQYFSENQISPHADWRMVSKTIIILAWLVVSYILLAYVTTSFVMAIITAVAVAQGLALVGFNIMHDGNHESYSKHKKLNKIMGFTLNLVGGSHYFWRHKHNILHHTYTNITELDEDIRVDYILRLSPAQKRYPWQRFQHLYALPAYSLTSLLWVTLGDFRKFFTRRIGDYQMPKLSATESFVFFLSKIFYFGYMLILPMFFRPVWQVLLFFVIVHLVLGVTLAVIFQLAHTVEGNTFPQPHPQTGSVENEWAIHEVETTADFAPRSKVAAWYLGGLNFQIEHHLFPRICHVHYPTISKIVKQVCEEFGVSYVSYPRMRDAIAAHLRFLKRMGREDAVVATPS